MTPSLALIILPKELIFLNRLPAVVRMTSRLRVFIERHRPAYTYINT